jgi:hypothetical protein
MKEGRGIGTGTNPETSYTATWANGLARSSSSVEPTEPASIIFATSSSQGSISKTGNEHARRLLIEARPTRFNELRQQVKRGLIA